jgi:predicted phosphodiesterase
VRVAALYDIHGNAPALRAVLAEVERAAPDLVVIGGDVAGGPMPAATLDALSALGPRARWVRGNGDRELAEAYDARAGGREPPADTPAEATAAWASARLSPAQRELLGSFAPVVAVDVTGLGPTLFCHGSPRSDTEIVTVITPDARLGPTLDGVTEPVVVCGHTHQQFDRRVGTHRVVNAGSVGMPYEGDAAAFWLLLGPHVELRRTGYDVAAAVEELRATGFPDADDVILRDSLLEPADRTEVAAFLEGLARRTG